MDKKLCRCFVDMEKSLDRVPKKVMEWSIRQRWLPKMLVKAITRTWVELELSEKFFVKIGVHQGLVLSSLLFAIVVDVVTEDAREGLMDKFFYADDLRLTSETIKNLQRKFLKWKMAFERKEMKVNIKKTKVMVC